MKNFNNTIWNETLAAQNWEKIGQTENVHEMATILSASINTALDICAPKKVFVIKPCYKQGLSQEAKELMKKRNIAREELRRNPTERKACLIKYKKLRNEVTNKIRQDVKNSNGIRIEAAKSENEMWKVVNEISKPREEPKWSIKDGEKVCTNEEEIANKFNDHFIEKVANLKEGIDKAKVIEPLDKLKARMDKKNLKFTLKTVSEKTVEKIMKGMRNKKSAGHDNISQECLLMGKKFLQSH